MSSAKPGSAVIIKGNPKHIKGNSLADAFYSEIASELRRAGFSVSYDEGKPYTQPRKADVWVAHSRGADRLRFAPKGTRVIAFGAPRYPDDKHQTINSPKDDLRLSSWGQGNVAAPGNEHYEFTPKMRGTLRAMLKKEANAVLKPTVPAAPKVNTGVRAPAATPAVKAPSTIVGSRPPKPITPLSRSKKFRPPSLGGGMGAPSMPMMRPKLANMEAYYSGMDAAFREYTGLSVTQLEEEEMAKLANEAELFREQFMLSPEEMLMMLLQQQALQRETMSFPLPEAPGHEQTRHQGADQAGGEEEEVSQQEDADEDEEAENSEEYEGSGGDT